MTVYLLLLLSTIHLSSGLVGHDCAHPVTTRIYSTDVISSCEQAESSGETEVPWSGTVLQVPNTSTRDHRTCQLILKATSLYCTYFKNPTQLELPSDDHTFRTYYLSEADCIRAWRDGLMTYHGVSIRVAPGKVTPILIGADLDSSGFCKTSTGTSKVLKGHLSLVTAPVVEYVDLLGNPRKRLLDGSQLTWSNSGLSSTTVDGIVVLSNEVRTERCTWRTLYQGIGALVPSIGGNTYVVVPALSSGFKLIGASVLCGVKVSHTDDPSVFLANTTALVIDSAQPTFSGSLSSAVGAGIMGLNLLGQLSTAKTAKAILKNQCYLEELGRKALLNQAVTHPDYVAMVLTGGPGWSVTVAGSSFVLSECREVPIVIHPGSECYTDIPVINLNTNKTLFIDPITRVLRMSSHPIACNDSSSPTFDLRGVRYRLAPGLIRVDLAPPLPSRLEFLNTTLSAPSQGLYPYEIMQSLGGQMDHVTRKEEVTRQLLRMGSGSFSQVQDHSDVLGNLAGVMLQTVSGHWLLVLVVALSVLSMILHLSVLWVLFRLGAFRLVLRRQISLSQQMARLGLTNIADQ